ncbi:MAG: flagellar hook-length control protein FliK [Desulfovibrio sp.]|nr:flagellar hook-length control protein FliK [Desulfovibrio sp.]
MQILPTMSVQDMSPQAQLQAAINQSLAQFSTSFADSLNTAEASLDVLNSPLNEETKEEEKTSESSSSSVYSQPSYAAESYTLDEVCFTQQEVTGLLNSLLQKNVSPKKLAGLKKLAELPQGANLGQVLKALKGKKEEISVSDEDANAITSLMNGIDPSGNLASSVLEALYANKPEQALRSVMDALEGLDFNENISLSEEEVLVFGQALGLDTETQKRLADFFGDAESGTTNPEGLKKILTPASEAVLSAKKEEDTLNSALQKTLGPVLDKAKKRMAEEANAQTLKSRESEQSKVYIDRTVQDESRKTLNATLEKGYTDRNEYNTIPDDQEPSSHPSAQAVTLRPENGNTVISGNQQNFDQGKQHEKKEDGWKELLSRVQGPTNKTHHSAPHHLDTAMSQPFQASFQTHEMGRSDIRQNLPLPQQVASQVETGLFQTLRNGASRLELQLHPQELGSLAITLVSRNGEVSAHIKADNAETVEMLHRQSEIIKMNLEEQGIKIDKIEIELRDTNNQENNEQQLLQDMANHNSFQEEDARRQQLRRLRNLATIQNSREKSISSDLEQSVQRESDSEINATRILDRVA